MKFFDTRSDATHARMHAHTYEGSRGTQRRNKTDTEEDGFGRRGGRRFYASYNHSYLLRYKQKYARALPSRAYHYHRCRVSGINVKCVECVQFGDGLRKRRGEGWSCCLYISGWYNAIVCGRTHMWLIVTIKTKACKRVECSSDMLERESRKKISDDTLRIASFYSRDRTKIFSIQVQISDCTIHCISLVNA